MVAMKTLPRRPSRPKNSPKAISLRPPPYTCDVSKKLTPASYSLARTGIPSRLVYRPPWTIRET
ncbi:MAG TPA: hypothetical protein VM431_13130 [Phycisphaerae bacterium]|nr:hypothetical protein [Phycisphaerae bacterium]